MGNLGTYEPIGESSKASLAKTQGRKEEISPNTVYLDLVAQAVEPAEPRFISAFLAALDQG